MEQQPLVLTWNQVKALNQTSPSSNNTTDAPFRPHDPAMQLLDLTAGAGEPHMDHLLFTTRHFVQKWVDEINVDYPEVAFNSPSAMRKYKALIGTPPPQSLIQVADEVYEWTQSVSAVSGEKTYIQCRVNYLVGYRHINLPVSDIHSQLARRLHDLLIQVLCTGGVDILAFFYISSVPPVNSGWVLGGDLDTGNKKVLTIGIENFQGSENALVDTVSFYRPSIQKGDKELIVLSGFWDRDNPALSVDQLQKLDSWAEKATDHHELPKRVFWALSDPKSKPELVAVQPHEYHKVNRDRKVHRLLGSGEVLAQGRAVSKGVVIGTACHADVPGKIKEGSVVIVDNIDPSWQRAIGRAVALLSARGGRTSHAAIIAAEQGIPAIVGCGSTIKNIPEGTELTVASEDGIEGKVFRGNIDHDTVEVDVSKLPETKTKVMLNIGNPDRVFPLLQMPNMGIGLARLEFLISRIIGVHPLAVLNPNKLKRTERNLISKRIRSVTPQAYIEKLVQGISKLCVAAGDKPVYLRYSDFRSDEYRHLIGGEFFEPTEVNPALGLRGASRYVSSTFSEVMELECAAIKAVRDAGFMNLHTIVPFVRTPTEAEAVIDKIRQCGVPALADGGPSLNLMCEIPSNIILGEEFCALFDGCSLGLNDLTQMVLGVDRDSPTVAHIYDEGHPAVLKMAETAIDTWKSAGKNVGVCGRKIGSDLNLVDWFSQREIDSISVESSRATAVWLHLSGKGVQ